MILIQHKTLKHSVMLYCSNSLVEIPGGLVIFFGFSAVRIATVALNRTGFLIGPGFLGFFYFGCS